MNRYENSGATAGQAGPLAGQEAGDGPSLLHRLDARVKILGFVGLIVVVVSTPARAVWAFALYAAILAFLVGLSRLPVISLLRRCLVVVPFVLVVAIFLPFFHRAAGGGYGLGSAHVSSEGLLLLWNVAAKAILGVLGAVILGATTTFPDMAQGLSRLRVPHIFVLVVSFMYRYSFLFVDELRRMQRAMASRNYRARWLANVPVLGRMLGALFLRSYQRGERVYLAMISRGYEGRLDLSGGRRLGATDLVFLVLLLGIAVTVRVFASVVGS